MAEQRTKIRRPHGRSRTRTAEPREQSPLQPPHPSAPVVHGHSGGNPLIEEAATLLSLAYQVSNQPHDPGVNALREQIGREIRTFARNAGERRLDQKTVQKASYVLCTAIDEAVMDTPWGADSEWTVRPLLAEFHGDTFGGELFFEKILKEARDDPTRYLNLLELMYLCMAFGFEGVYKLGRQSELEGIRNDLYAQIRRHRQDAEYELSPHWRGKYDQRKRLARYIPAWVIGAFGTMLLLGIFLWFKINIDELSTPLAQKLTELGQEKPSFSKNPIFYYSRYQEEENQPGEEPTDEESAVKPSPFPEKRDVRLEFVTRGSELTSEHHQKMYRFVAMLETHLKAYPRLKRIDLKIIGRASPPGARAYNRELSGKRAKSVAASLRKIKGLPAAINIVYIKGIGVSDLLPASPGASRKEFNRINQSVQILVSYQE
ncbi:MAG: OmpA family protein [Gammaproteobacteria bacterium]|nr:OmpA family protein [Gammaproteobacteria bacterium]